jgi:transposase
VRANPNSTVPRRVVDRLGAETTHEMIEARRAGEPLKEVAKKYGVSESSVKRLARQF